MKQEPTASAGLHRCLEDTAGVQQELWRRLLLNTHIKADVPCPFRNTSALGYSPQSDTVRYLSSFPYTFGKAGVSEQHGEDSRLKQACRLFGDSVRKQMFCKRKIANILFSKDDYFGATRQSAAGKLVLRPGFLGTHHSGIAPAASDAAVAEHALVSSDVYRTVSVTSPIHSTIWVWYGCGVNGLLSGGTRPASRSFCVVLEVLFGVQEEHIRQKLQGSQRPCELRFSSQGLSRCPVWNMAMTFGVQEEHIGQKLQGSLQPCELRFSS
ncbi:hypothetical protein Anapl_10803 [Anas platyrhynchos]|uniref:Uncharacterized protein n=1 Tax=Anas platyrhynchos TaxID=8839 RepID=R0KG41_ANAPL|nr:hypothetical protein Anapl_10803 [Anas platyrhynchos]